MTVKEKLVALLAKTENSAFYFSDIYEKLGGNYNTLHSTLTKLIVTKRVNIIYPGLNGGRKNIYYFNK